MNKLNKILSCAAILACAGIYLNGCTSTTSPTGAASSNVMVIGATNGSITVSWTRDGSDASGTDSIIVKNGVTGGPDVGNSPVLVSSGSQGTVTGLTTNTLYTITVNSTNGASSPITYTIGEAATNFGVRANSSTSIAAKWTRGAGDNSLDTLVAYNGATVTSMQTTSGNSATLTGLTAGQPYTIALHQGNSDADIPGATWMTAGRSTGIRVYESADQSSSDPSGLIFGSGDNGTKAVSLSNGNADFVLQTVTGTPVGISLVSGDVYKAGWNSTGVDPNPNYIVGGLDSDYRSSDYSSELALASGAGAANSFDLPATALSGSRVLICQTSTGNLALVEIVPDPSTGLLYSGTPGSRYVTLNVSYQSAVDQPYAARARSRNYGSSLAPRVSAH